MNVLFEVWRDYATLTSVQRRSLQGFARHLYRARLAKPSDPGVRLLTIHKVKGLEFKAVCLVGAFEGSLPHYRSKSDVEIDEERRAFYVAITRASRDLLITYPVKTVDHYGRTHLQKASRFISEANVS